LERPRCQRIASIDVDPERSHEARPATHGYRRFDEARLSTSLLVPLGIVELACTILYIVPQTSVLGAILLTGYLGGATATHLRVEESWIGPVLLGILVWLGLFLRDCRLRALLPLRKF
jgi:hypothetical protein